MNLDGIYTPAADADPVVGVTLQHADFRLAERQATIEVAYWTKSGALFADPAQQPIRISQDEHDKFAALLYANVRAGKMLGQAVIAALSTMNRIPRVATVIYREFVGSLGTGTFVVGEIIYVGATPQTATKQGIVTKVAGTVAAPIIDYHLIAPLTDFVNADVVKGGTSLASCTAAASIVLA